MDGFTNECPAKTKMKCTPLIREDIFCQETESVENHRKIIGKHMAIIIAIFGDSVFKQYFE